MFDLENNTQFHLHIEVWCLNWYECLPRPSAPSSSLHPIGSIQRSHILLSGAQCTSPIVSTKNWLWHAIAIESQPLTASTYIVCSCFLLPTRPNGQDVTRPRPASQPHNHAWSYTAQCFGLWVKCPKSDPFPLLFCLVRQTTRTCERKPKGSDSWILGRSELGLSVSPKRGRAFSRRKRRRPM